MLASVAGEGTLRAECSPMVSSHERTMLVEQRRLQSHSSGRERWDAISGRPADLVHRVTNAFHDATRYTRTLQSPHPVRDGLCAKRARHLRDNALPIRETPGIG